MITTKSNQVSRSAVKQGLLSVFIMLFGIFGAVFALSFGAIFPVPNPALYTYAGWTVVFISAIWLFRLPQKVTDSEEDDDGIWDTYSPISGGIIALLVAIAIVGYL